MRSHGRDAVALTCERSCGDGAVGEFDGGCAGDMVMQVMGNIQCGHTIAMRWVKDVAVRQVKVAMRQR